MSNIGAQVIATSRYAAEVGIPHPSKIQIAPVKTSSKSRLSPTRLATALGSLTPKPVIVIVIITNPNTAHIAATLLPISAPRHNPSIKVDKDGLVEGLIKLITTSNIVPQKAANIGENSNRSKIVSTMSGPKKIGQRSSNSLLSIFIGAVR